MDDLGDFMNRISWLILAVAVAAVAAAAAVWIVGRWRRGKQLQALNDMLDKAMTGEFIGEVFDESVMSAIESKLAAFLSSSLLAADNLQAEQDKIKALISDISHQTKMPITNICLYAQLLRECELPPKAVEYVEQLNRQADKLNFLIGALIKTSRLETGVFSLAPRRGSVANLIGMAVEQVAPKAESKGISLSVEDVAAAACFDKKWTVEALYNILDNAVKYTARGGAVRVSVVEYEMFCRIDIEDNGMGIAEDEQAQIFARFYRSPAVNQLDGVGIGLYLAQRIISEQGGYIKVESTSGMGSKFSVFLPWN